jgi:hypothetical protein
MSEPFSGAVAGIDVGFSTTRKSSAICRLWWDRSSIDWHICRYRATDGERDSTFKKMIGGRDLLAIALDGPLRCRLDIIAEYRLAERMLTVRLAKKIGKPGQSNSPVGKSLNAEANICAALALSVAEIRGAEHAPRINPRAVVEAFPSSFLGLMLSNPAPSVTRGTRSDAFFSILASESGGLSQLAAYLLPGRTPKNSYGSVQNHDDRAALVCAFTALCVAFGNFCAVGDSKNGWIILPPRQFIAQSAFDLLTANAKEFGEGSLYITPPFPLATS